jgi:hypothetical protein
MIADDKGAAVGGRREVDRGVYGELDDGDDEAGEAEEDREEFVRMFEEEE